MRKVVAPASLAAILVIAGAVATPSGAALAQDTRIAPVRTALSQPDAQNQTEAPQAQRRGLRFNEDGRWGLNFNFQQPVGRETEWGDVEAGAYYRVNPRLRFGAAAGLAEPEPDPARAAQTERRAQPRVRLETIFKF